MSVCQSCFQLHQNLQTSHVCISIESMLGICRRSLRQHHLFWQRRFLFEKWLLFQFWCRKLCHYSRLWSFGDILQVLKRVDTVGGSFICDMCRPFSDVFFYQNDRLSMICVRPFLPRPRPRGAWESVYLSGGQFRVKNAASWWSIFPLFHCFAKLSSFSRRDVKELIVWSDIGTLSHANMKLR